MTFDENNVKIRHPWVLTVMKFRLGRSTVFMPQQHIQPISVYLRNGVLCVATLSRPAVIGFGLYYGSFVIKSCTFTMMIRILRYLGYSNCMLESEGVFFGGHLSFCLPLRLHLSMLSISRALYISSTGVFKILSSSFTSVQAHRCWRLRSFSSLSSRKSLGHSLRELSNQTCSRSLKNVISCNYKLLGLFRK